MAYSDTSDEEVDLNNPNLDAALHQAEQLLGIPPEQASQQDFAYEDRVQSGPVEGYSNQARQRPLYQQSDSAWLRSALAEREAQLEELQDQHLRLVQRSQEARQNWESALESKDRALTQLEDALVTQKRTLQQQMDQQQAAVSMTHNQLIQGTDAQIAMQRQLDQSQQQVASLETALSQAQGRLAEHSSGSEVRAARAEQDRWRWQSEAEELRTLLASRDREIGKMQSKQEELTSEMADLKSQAQEKSSPPRVWFAPTPHAPGQYQQHPYQQQQQQHYQQQPQHQQQQQAQQMYGGQPALMWEQNVIPGDGRQSWPAPPQTAGTNPGEAAAAVQLPQLLQKLQKTQEKLESRDASARKYKDAVRALKARLSDATAALQISHSEALRLRTRVADLKAAVSWGDVRNSGGGGASECGTGRVLQDRLNQLHEGLASKEKAHKALAEEVEASQEKLSKAQKHSAACEAKISALQQQLEEVGRQAERRIDRAEARGADLQHDLHQAQHRAHQAEADFSSLAERVREGEGRAAETDRAAREALHRFAQAEAQLQSTERELAEAQKQWSQSEAQAAEAHRHTRELQGQLAEADGRAKEMQQQLDRSQTRLRHLETALHKAEREGAQELAAARHDWDSLHKEDAQELREAKVASTRAQASRDKAESRCAELEGELDTQRAAAIALRQAHASESSRQAASEAKLAGMQQQLDSRQDAFDNLKGDLDAMEAHHKQVEADWRTQLSRRTAALSDANRRFTELESVMRRIAGRSSVGS
ncbi:hypothetical protein WJX79_003394 [Trebouxia sp. C0005]